MSLLRQLKSKRSNTIIPVMEIVTHFSQLFCVWPVRVKWVYNYALLHLCLILSNPSATMFRNPIFGRTDTKAARAKPQAPRNAYEVLGFE